MSEVTKKSEKLTTREARCGSLGGLLIYIITDDKFLLRNYDKKWTIEMDRFVHNLEGSESETIERESAHSAATMKEQGSSLIEYNYLYS